MWMGIGYSEPQVAFSFVWMEATVAQAVPLLSGAIVYMRSIALVWVFFNGVDIWDWGTWLRDASLAYRSES